MGTQLLGGRLFHHMFGVCIHRAPYGVRVEIVWRRCEP